MPKVSSPPLYRICIVTGAHLCRNPRVVKEAVSLQQAGYKVTVLGPAWDGSLSKQDATLVQEGGFTHRAVVDLREKAGWRRHWHRLVRRVSSEAVARLGWQRPEALGYGMRPLLRAARREKADLFIGHQEVGAWVVWRLMKDGRRAGADLEDWYSEDLLPESRRSLPLSLLRRIEGDLLREALHVTTTSQALAEALATRYDAPEPLVIYNAFPWSDRDHLDGRAQDRPSTDRPSLHWVSQTLGAGRGLDVLFEALRDIETPLDVHLRGRTDTAAERWLHSAFPEGPHRLTLHSLVSPGDLLSRIAEHDIGLALEETTPPSRNLTVTNKILHYLLGGLAVVATKTAGQCEVASVSDGAMRLCRNGDAADLAEQIEALVADRAALRRAKASALEVAQARFCWEQQVPALLASVRAALSGERASVTSGATHHPAAR